MEAAAIAMRWLLGLLILTALAGVAWLLSGETAAGGGGEPVAEERAAPEVVVPGGVQLQGLAAEGPRGPKSVVGRCTLQCRVLRDGVPAVAVVEARYVESAAAIQQQMWGQRWQRDMFQPPVPPGPPGPATASGSSDAQGSLAFEGLSPGGYRVSARTQDGWRAEANGLLPADGARVLLTLDLKAADQVLEGRVTWSDGKPVAGTLVLTPPLSRPMGAPTLVTTLGQVAVDLGADGSFRLGGLVAGSHGVRVLVGTGPGGAGIVVTGQIVVLPATKPYVLVLDMPAQRVTGRVLNGATDAPVPGATVVSTGTLGPNVWGSLRATAGEDGRFDLLLPRMPTTVYVSAPGFGMAQRYVLAAGSDVTIRLLRTARIAGRVTTSAGAPAVGAVVGASCGTPSGGQTRFVATADRDGRYALEDVLAGEAVVVVRGGGWASPDVSDVRDNGFNPFFVTVPGGASLTLDLLAVPTGRIEGKVVDAAGAPVAGASIVAMVSGSPNGGQIVHRLSQAVGTESAASDAQGAFVLANLAPGFLYSLTATASDQPQASAGPFTVTGETATPAEVKFPAARFVDVRVLFEGEETPVAEAMVTLVLMQPQGQGWNSLGSWSTDREGRVRAGPVAPGDLGVTVSGEMVAQRNQPVLVEGSKDGPGPFAVTVRMARGRTIEGRVLRPDGTPAVGVWVNVHARDGRHNVGASTTSDGSFTAKGLGTGTYNVNAHFSQPGKPTLQASVPAESGATGVTLTLVEAAASVAREAIVLRILDDRGEPVRSAQTRLTCAQSSWGNHANEGTVRYEFDKQNNPWILTALANGTLYVDVWAARSWADMPLATGPTRVGPLGSEQREVEVRLAAERSIEGRVTTADGAPVRGVLVRARFSGNSTEAAALSSGEGRCDERGRFRVGNLSEGDHLLEVAVPPDFLTPEAQTVAVGTRTVEFKLRRGVSARIRVRDADGQPVAKASVSVQARAPDVVQQPGQPRRRMRGQNQQQLGVATGPDGTAVLRGLDPDALWTLSVGPNREDLRHFSQDRWTPADLDVRLERGYVVSGVVKDPQGRALPGSQVMRRYAENNWGGIGMGQDGTFRLTGLDRGPVTLAAWAPGVNADVNDPNLQILTVAAGTENVVLTVDPGCELAVRVTNVSDRGPNGRNLQFTLMTRRAEQWVHVGSANENEGTGRALFKGLKADERYTVWVQPAGNEYYGWLTDLRPGGGEVLLRLERGGTIRGRLTVVGAYEQLWVGAGNDMACWVQGTVDADGRYEIQGVPYGAWKIQAWATVQRQHWHATADGAAGATVDLRLEAPPTR